jgi:hypothetical protein
MKKTLITDYEQVFNEKDILNRIGMPENHAFGDSIKALLEKTKIIAKPKAIYLECPIEERTDHSVTIGGQVFNGFALAKRLATVETVYPYVCTCGKELAEYADTITDMVEQFAFNEIMEYYRKQMDISLSAHLSDIIPEGTTLSGTKPGSLVGWPIQEQKKLFAVLGEAADEAGVSLNENYLMFPIKSVSGIKFAVKNKKHDCELCQRRDCPDRKVPFNRKAYLEAMEEH